MQCVKRFVSDSRSGPTCNRWFRGPPESTTQTASRSVQPFCTAHCRVSSGVPGHVLFAKNYAFALGDLETRLIHGCFGPPESKSQTASRSVQPFLRCSLQSRYILYNGPPLPPYNCPFYGGSEPPSSTWFLGPTELSTQTASRRVGPFLQRSLL